MSSAGPALVRQSAFGTTQTSRSPFAELLHALNQPLTGLQCLLELAGAGPRPAHQYLQAIRESLELTERMRTLVEALRELSDLQQDHLLEETSFSLNALLQETIEELRPIAESAGIRIGLNPAVGLTVKADRRLLSAMMFRLVESVLTLAASGSELRLSLSKDGGRAVLELVWTDGPSPQRSPFSQAELGLLIARAGFEREGSEWARCCNADCQICTVRLPLVRSAEHS